MGDTHSPPKVAVFPTRSRAVFREASELYGRVFDYAARDQSLNAKLLSAMVANGGSAVAATAHSGELVGFAYGFPGIDTTGATGASRPYLYSQATFIDAAHQGLGLGRRLKMEQRELAAAAGLSSMRWAFDPVLARNAHFNLDVLGARGIRFAPRYYDEPGSDRLLVDWQFEAAPAGAPDAAVPTLAAHVAGGDWGRPIGEGDAVWVPIPATPPTEFLPPRAVEALRLIMAETLGDLSARGYTAVSCVRVDEECAAYRFEAPKPAIGTAGGSPL
jgi:predicted GNAT superfamily acetyltransferase